MWRQLSEIRIFDNAATTFTTGNKMAKRISIINFKGDVGKTTLSFNFAAGLARCHQAKVLLMDMDHQSSLSIVCLGARDWLAQIGAGNIGNRGIHIMYQNLTKALKARVDAP